MAKNAMSGAHGRQPPLWRQLLGAPLNWLLVAVPISFWLKHQGADDRWIFAISGLAIIPLAGLMGRATESLAESFGAGIGGLLNATFGNAAELIIALMAVQRGPQMYPIVKASITGSIIGNVLLVLGAAIVAGGVRYKRQTFNRTAASLSATLLALATIGLVIPTLYFHASSFQVGPSATQTHVIESLSEEIAAILAFVYLLHLVFSLATHRDLFIDEEGDSQGKHEKPEWSRRQAVTVLLLATVGVAFMSEQLVGSVEQAAESLGLTSVFVGVIVVAIVGNAAEHSTAVLVAMKNKMNLSVNIAVGSGIQIALFVAPVLVFASMAIHPHQPLDLHFTPMEIIAMSISILVMTMVSQDGESNWMEGVMLLAVYAILALAFFYLPAAG